MIIAPILLEMINDRTISIFSGENLDIDPENGSNHWKPFLVVLPMERFGNF